jgi:hypothetical protein
MNQQRYKAFRTARVTITTLPLDEAQQSLLLDAAEGMLLARDVGDDAVQECLNNARWSLETGCASGLLDSKDAGQIIRQLKRCGPEPDVETVASAPSVEAEASA